MIMKECCENCVFLLNINKHPWNREFGKGIISEQLGWGCGIALDDELKSDDKYSNITYFDFNSGNCEMFTPKDKYKLSVKVEKL